MAPLNTTFGQTRSIHAHLAPDLSVTRVLVAWSPDAALMGRAWVLEGDGLSVGRQSSRSDAALQLADGAVSRAHARFVPEGIRWVVEDAGSRNGTCVDGARTDRAPLRHGAVVRVGDTLLLVQELTVRRDEKLVGESGPLLGTSLAMERVRGQIASVAEANIPVLIHGPSGTGKELVAAELHRASGRTGAFVPVNCGALPRDLAESELFGHVAGAFTGAARSKDGLVTAAADGTLFLDEIGELPLELQAKLLRVLATGEVRPVGATSARTSNARIVAATHRDLHADVEDERFRGDLLARLVGWTIVVPPLHDRPADILGIALRSEPGLQLEADAAEALLLHDWPWNVRELLQVVRAAKVRAGGEQIALRHLPAPLQAPLQTRSRTSLPAEAFVSAAQEVPPTYRIPRDRTPTREDLDELLCFHEGNVSRVAAFFGKERAQVYRWIRRHELDAEAYRES